MTQAKFNQVTSLMSNFMLKIVISVVICLNLISCSKKDDATHDTTNVSTVFSDTIIGFSAKVNGVVYTSKDISMNYTTYGFNKVYSYTIRIAGSSIKFGLYPFWADIKANSTLLLGTSDRNGFRYNDPVTGIFDCGFTDNFNPTCGSGNMKITGLNPGKNKVSGTFSGVAANVNDHRDTVVVTEGKFSGLPY